MAEFDVVTLVGSTRFRAEILDAGRRLTLGGHIVLGLWVFTGGGDRVTAAEGRMLARLHHQQIAMADWVYVVNPGGYIGESTRAEINEAARAGKRVQYMVPAS